MTQDGRVLCEADCGSTTGGSRPYLSLPGGGVSPLAFGGFMFSEPVACLGEDRVLLFGLNCPMQTGACTTTLAIASGSTLTLISTPVQSGAVLNDSNELGWAIGWGGTSVGDSWRVRPEGTLEPLEVPGAWAVTATGVSLSGSVSGSAYIGSFQHAVRWDASGAVTLLEPLEVGTSAQGAGIGMDGSVVGQSNGRAVRWVDATTSMSLLPVGSSSVATHMAGNPMAGNPLGVSYFGTHQNRTRLFRATGPDTWSDIGSIAATAQLTDLQVVAAPRPDFMVAIGLSPMYQRKSIYWSLMDGTHPLESLIVNPPAGSATNPLEVIDANAQGVLLVRQGFNGAAYRLARLNDGDTDGDGVVSGADIAVLLASWGAVPTGVRGAADLDGNRVVDATDLALLLANWS